MSLEICLKKEQGNGIAIIRGAPKEANPLALCYNCKGYDITCLGYNPKYLELGGKKK